jgi:prepilin peptidase CpaA
MMIAQWLVIFALPALLAAAAGWDLASFTIPNFLQGALLSVFAAFAIAAGLSLPEIGFHLLAGLIGLVIGFGLFAAGYIGGGDAKLFAAMLLWLGFSDIVPYALYVSLFGGALTLSLLFLRNLPLPALLARQRWLLRLHDEKSGIPYGVALSLGAFWILPQSEIFHLAAV